MHAVDLKRQDWEVQVIPELGGKVCAIRWRGRELLAKNPRKPLRPARYAAPFSEFDASCFDECFPTIGPCRYPEYPWAGTELPDHGEVWSLPWTSQCDEDRICLDTSGIRIPYHFTKSISITDTNAVRFQYQVSNPTPFPIRYLWSAHPLFAIRPEMRILLPAGVRVRVDWSKDGRLGPIWQEHSWPNTIDHQGNPVDLSLISGPETGRVDKLYTGALSEGWCSLCDPQQKTYLAFVFSPQQIPYVGLSINLGGWPVDEPGYYNLGLEPCTGYPDRLDHAVERGVCPTLAPYGSARWGMTLYAGVWEEEAALAAHLGRLSQQESDLTAG